ncbi:MAG TPA: tail fiber protein [Thermoanaerobaculia bacterium]|nr:tail fiber protein [Thermoanaerobaculia bacterium]
MGTPFMSEIKLISWNFSPKGWAFCNGQFLPINQNQALFSLLGTTYGGNGQTTFALPDLRGRVPIHFGSGFTLGQAAGQPAHTVTQSEMPAHNHFVGATNGAATVGAVFNNIFASAPLSNFASFANLTTLHPSSITNVGGSQPHNNMQPYLCINFIIALQGAFPSQN